MDQSREHHRVSEAAPPLAKYVTPKSGHFPGISRALPPTPAPIPAHSPPHPHFCF